MTKKVLSIFDEGYEQWVTALKQRYRQSQVKATVKVNAELLSYYWSLGRDIVTMKPEEKWGQRFYYVLSRDLRQSIPDAQGFSVRNLQRMKQYYELFSDFPITPQVVAQIEKGLIPDGKEKTQQSIERSDLGITPQDVAQLLSVPWGHICLILNHVGKDRKKALFYVNQTVTNNWSRAMLLSFIKSDLYARQGKAINNFRQNLPEIRGDLAKEITRDPYNFNFLAIEKGYDERKLKDALVDNIQRFLVELGTGFAYMGREYRIQIGNKEEFIDLLFYNTKVHAYVVIEVKASEFEPRDIGQVGTYVVAVDHLLKGDRDEKTIGLLVCKDKDEYLARYALESSSQPLGISSFELSNLIPEKYQSDLPSIEEIENELNKK